MSDLKAAFRAAQEARGTGKPTPAQIRAARAAKLAQQQQGSKPAGQASAPAPAPAPKAAPAQQSKLSADSKRPASQLPDDFFQSGPAPTKKVASPAAPAPASKPQSAPQPSTSGRGTTFGQTGRGPGAGSVLPEGFYQDKTADAKARGVKLPDEKDKEEEFQAFQRSIEEDMKQAAAQEAEEAEEEAADREDKEDFAQWLRNERIRELQQRRNQRVRSDDPDASGDAAAQPAVDDAATVTAQMMGLLPEAVPSSLENITLARKRRLKDTLAMLEATGDSDEDMSGDDDAGLDGLLDWRAKNV